MKKFLKFIFVFTFIFVISADVFAKPRAKSKSKRAASKSKRAAAGVGGLKSGSKKSDSSDAPKKEKSSTKSSKKSKIKATVKKSGGNEEDKTEDDENSENTCVNEGIETLLSKECKFLNEKEIIESLGEKFYCIYQTKEKGKAESVYDIFLYQNYGIKESSLKDGEGDIVIKNPGNGKLKGTGKYYEFILKNLADNTLKHGMILDFLTENIIDSNESLFGEQVDIVQEFSVPSVALTVDFTKNEIENCRKATKKVMQSCGISNDSDVQESITSNCSIYSSALTKNTADKKNKVLAFSTELAKILLLRASDILDAADLKTSLDERSFDNEKRQNKIDSERQDMQDEKLKKTQETDDNAGADGTGEK